MSHNKKPDLESLSPEAASYIFSLMVANMGMIRWALMEIQNILLVEKGSESPVVARLIDDFTRYLSYQKKLHEEDYAETDDELETLGASLIRMIINPPELIEAAGQEPDENLRSRISSLCPLYFSVYLKCVMRWMKDKDKGLDKLLRLILENMDRRINTLPEFDGILDSIKSELAQIAFRDFKSEYLTEDIRDRILELIKDAKPFKEIMNKADRKELRTVLYAMLVYSHLKMALDDEIDSFGVMKSLQKVEKYYCSGNRSRLMDTLADLQEITEELPFDDDEVETLSDVDVELLNNFFEINVQALMYAMLVPVDTVLELVKLVVKGRRFDLDALKELVINLNLLPEYGLAKEEEAKAEENEDWLLDILTEERNRQEEEYDTLATGEYYLLSLKLDNVSKPPVTRQIIISADDTFGDLHYAIQAVMGWENDHLYQFGKKAYDSNVHIATHHDPMGDKLDFATGLDADRVKINRYINKNCTKFKYVYNFRVDWIVSIELKEIYAPGEMDGPTRCIKGRGASVSEICGSPYNFLRLRAMSEELNLDNFEYYLNNEETAETENAPDPTDKRDYYYLTQALGPYYDPDKRVFDFKTFDIDEANSAL